MRYGLGPRLSMIGEAAALCVPELVVARPAMNQLAAELPAECTFSTVVKDEIVILGSTGPVRLGEPTLHVGSRMPCAPPLGTVFVAWFSEAERAERRAQGLDHGYDAIADELAAIRRRGYVATLQSSDQLRLSRVLSEIPDSYFNRAELRNALEERLAEMSTTVYLASHERGVAPQDIASVQAPVFQDGSPRFALTVSGLPRRLTGAELAALGKRVRAAANEVSNSIDGLGKSVRSAV
jgi:DNA-binding IclR family transcriptional regulator